MIRVFLSKRPLWIVLFILLLLFAIFGYQFWTANQTSYGHNTVFDVEAQVVLSCSTLCADQQQCGLNMESGVLDVYTNAGGAATIGNNRPLPNNTIVTVKSVQPQQMFSQSTGQPREGINFYEIELDGARSWVAGWCVAAQ